MFTWLRYIKLQKFNKYEIIGGLIYSNCHITNFRLLAPKLILIHCAPHECTWLTMGYSSSSWVLHSVFIFSFFEIHVEYNVLSEADGGSRGCVKIHTTSARWEHFYNMDLKVPRNCTVILLKSCPYYIFNCKNNIQY